MWLEVPWLSPESVAIGKFHMEIPIGTWLWKLFYGDDICADIKI